MKKNRLAASATMISIFTLISKFLGFSREIMIGFVFGTTMETDAYFVAMSATVLFMGAVWASLNNTLIPTLSEIREKHGLRGKMYFFNNFFNIIVLLSLILATLSFILSPWIIKLLAKGFEGSQYELAIRLNRLAVPIIIFLAINYVFSSFLHSNGIFGPPAISGIPFNLVFLLFLAIFSKRATIEQLMMVSVIASSTQVLILVPAMRRSGWRYKLKLNFRDRYLRQVGIAVLPIIIGSSVQQLNNIIDKTLASSLEEGSITALTYSAKINDMVISVFILAVTTVIFPLLSQAFVENDREQIVSLTRRGVHIIFIITIPATIGLMLLSEPIVRLFFQRGAFTARSTELTAGALFYYTIGLTAIALNLVFNKIFYSLHETRTPMKVGILGMLINITLNLILIRPLAHGGLALATSIANLTITVLLFFNLRKKLGRFNLLHSLSIWIRTVTAAGIMGVFVYIVYYKLGGRFISSKSMDLTFLMISVIGGAFLYFVGCYLLRIPEFMELLHSMRKKFRK